MSGKHQGGRSVIEQLSAYVATESFDNVPHGAAPGACRAILQHAGRDAGSW